MPMEYGQQKLFEQGSNPGPRQLVADPYNHLSLEVTNVIVIFLLVRRVPNHEAELGARVHALPGQGQAQEVGHHGHPKDRFRRRGRRQVGPGTNRHQHPSVQATELHRNRRYADALCHGEDPSQ